MTAEPNFIPLEHSVYVGRDRVGRYLQNGLRLFVAFDCDDNPVGTFQKQKDACAAMTLAGREGAA